MEHITQIEIEEYLNKFNETIIEYTKEIHKLFEYDGHSLDVQGTTNCENTKKKFLVDLSKYSNTKISRIQEMSSDTNQTLQSIINKSIKETNRLNTKTKLKSLFQSEVKKIELRNLSFAKQTQIKKNKNDEINKMKKEFEFELCSIYNVHLQALEAMLSGATKAKDEIIRESDTRYKQREEHINLLLTEPMIYRISNYDEMLPPPINEIKVHRWYKTDGILQNYINRHLTTLLSSDIKMWGLLSADKFDMYIMELHNNELENMYKEGYDDGYDDGKRKGYDNGYDDGKRKGYDDGYDDGYASGQNN